MADYDKVGLLVVRDGRILLCRKKHTTALLILPGGCREPGETTEQTLLREIREELGDVRVDGLQLIGTYQDVAAVSDGLKMVQIELLQGTLYGEPVATSEIKELVWFGNDDTRELLSPILRRQILPDLLARRILTWAS